MAIRPVNWIRKLSDLFKTFELKAYDVVLCRIDLWSINQYHAYLGLGDCLKHIIIYECPFVVEGILD